MFWGFFLIKTNVYYFNFSLIAKLCIKNVYYFNFENPYCKWCFALQCTVHYVEVINNVTIFHININFRLLNHIQKQVYVNM